MRIILGCIFMIVLFLVCILISPLIALGIVGNFINNDK